jgi:hypothetical protein
MQSGLIALSPASEIALSLAQATFGIVLLLCIAVPAIRGMWSSLRIRPGYDHSPDLNELWKHSGRGEISWDEYLRDKIEGARGLAGRNKESSRNPAPDNVAS